MENEDVENTIFGRRDVLLNEAKLFKDKSFRIDEKDATPFVVQLLADVETLKAKVALLEDQVAEGNTPSRSSQPSSRPRSIITATLPRKRLKLSED